MTNHPILDTDLNCEVNDKIIGTPTDNLSDDQWQYLADSFYGHDRDRFLRPLFNAMLKEEGCTDYGYDEIVEFHFPGTESAKIKVALERINQRLGLQFFDTDLL